MYLELFFFQYKMLEMIRNHIWIHYHHDEKKKTFEFPWQIKEKCNEIARNCNNP
jgi:hypothetical protein